MNIFRVFWAMFIICAMITSEVLFQENNGLKIKLEDANKTAKVLMDKLVDAENKCTGINK